LLICKIDEMHELGMNALNNENLEKVNE